MCFFLDFKSLFISGHLVPPLSSLRKDDIYNNENVQLRVSEIISRLFQTWVIKGAWNIKNCQISLSCLGIRRRKKLYIYIKKKKLNLNLLLSAHVVLQHNFKTGHFSWKGLQRLWNVQKEKCTCKACETIVFRSLNMQICEIFVFAVVVVASALNFSSGVSCNPNRCNSFPSNSPRFHSSTKNQPVYKLWSLSKLGWVAFLFTCFKNSCRNTK